MDSWTRLLADTLATVIAELQRLDAASLIAARAEGVLSATRISPTAIGAKRGPGRPRRILDAEQLASLYATGYSLIDIAERVGASPQAVQRTLVEAGVEIRRAANGTAHRPETAARAERIRAMRAEGKTLAEIGAAEHLTRERVRQLCVKHGIDTKERHLRPEQAAIVAEYLGGTSLNVVADKHRIPISRLKNWVLLSGNKIRGRGSRHSPEILAKAERAAQLYRSGLKTQEVAEAVGVQQPRIYRLLSIAGVQPNRTSGNMEQVQ